MQGDNRADIILSISQLESMGSECLNTTKCTESFCQLLSSYATNWNDMDKKKVFCLFVKTTKLEQKVRAIITQ